MFIEILFKILLFKGGVLIYAEHCIYFLHPQIPDFKIVVSQSNIVPYKPYLNGKLISSAFI